MPKRYKMTELGAEVFIELLNECRITLIAREYICKLSHLMHTLFCPKQSILVLSSCPAHKAVCAKFSILLGVLMIGQVHLSM